MKKLVFLWLLGLVGLALAAPNNTSATYILYRWDKMLWVQSIDDGSQWQAVGPAPYGVEGLLPKVQIQAWELGPAPPPNAYGFHQGIWSPDGQKFAYVTLSSLNYELHLWESGNTRMVFYDTLRPEAGYLIPLGWLENGNLLLLERRMLHNLESVRIWAYDFGQNALAPYFNGAPAALLRGRSAIMPDQASAFLGFDTDNATGYIFHFESRQLSAFPISISLPDLSIKGSVFEMYPLEILGVLPSVELNSFMNQLALLPPQEAPVPDPFLYYPLPDDKRRITCYPDSAWTQAQHPVTCPVLGVMYAGHEGTDLSEPPQGLTRGTAVYAATEGLVIRINTGCEENSPSCGRAYGNYIGMEHHLVVAGNIQTWYTGYAHLQSVLVEPYAYIEDISVAIGASGATGSGGPHLHFEVRHPHGFGLANWVDPWDSSLYPQTLWVGAQGQPISAEMVRIP